MPQTSGTDAGLSADGVRVPFGQEAVGGMLAGRIGYISLFRLERREARPNGMADSAQCVS